MSSGAGEDDPSAVSMGGSTLAGVISLVIISIVKWALQTRRLANKKREKEENWERREVNTTVHCCSRGGDGRHVATASPAPKEEAAEESKEVI
jgi:hypothetical protein